MKTRRWIAALAVLAGAVCMLAGCSSATEENTVEPVAAAGVDAGEMVFAGWNTDPKGNGKTYKPGDTAPDDKDLDLYAQWVKKYNDFAYTGSAQTFTAPADGVYKFEAWGASGPDRSGTYIGTDGGHGGYTAGDIVLKKGDVIYVYVGGQNGDQSNDSFNGGGKGEMPGGGATDFRLASGNWNNFDSLKSRIMVAGGGGGGFLTGGAGGHPTSHSSGNAGGLTGTDAKSAYANGSDFAGHGASQTAGGAGGSNHGVESASISGNGSFGIGSGTMYSSGGGGGYYGGGHGFHQGVSWSGGGGGSSFISGYPGCNAIANGSTALQIIHTGQSIHYSGMKFFNTTMIAGDASMTSPTGLKETGHVGSGYARITYVQIDS